MTTIPPVEVPTPDPAEEPALGNTPVLPPVVREPISPAQPPALRPSPRPRRKRHVGRTLLGTLVVLALPILMSWAMVVAMSVWNWTPPRSSYMQIDAATLQDGETLTYQYVTMNNISRYMVAATIGHEDQQLGLRSGPFEWDDFKARVDAYLKGEADPSGSTIPQQLVKNIFLYPEQNAIRKGLEAVLAYELSYTMSPKRVMELYLNYAQFGPHLYGVCAASWYYFKHAPSDMTVHEAAQLMGVLPLPDLVRRAPQGGIDLSENANHAVWDLVNGAANVWVPQQVAGMGGWQSAVATIGIYDQASDYKAERDAHPDNPSNCSQWPDSVVERYSHEGILLDD